MYQFRYDHWDEKRFPGYADSMNHLYDESLSYYLQKHMNDLNRNDDLLKMRQIFGYMEYYFAALLKLRYVGKNNFQNILSQLKSIRMVQLLDPSLRDKFNGLTYQQMMTMNPTPGKFPGLDDCESLQLALYHELGHIIIESNHDDIEFLKNTVYREDEFKQQFFKDGFGDFSKGFEFLDEVVAQNVGEAILFDREGKERPSYCVYKNRVMNPEGTFTSNFLEYREFQELAYLFANCLDFIPKHENDTMCDVINRLSKAMFSRDFCKNIYSEFTKDSQKGEDLMLMLMCMGKIKDAKYACFGYGSRDDSLKDVSKYFQLFHEIASKYQDAEDSKVAQKVQG